MSAARLLPGIGLVCVTAILALMGVVQADDKHHSGANKVKLNAPGKQKIHQTSAGHTVHAHVTNKNKVQNVSVSHKTKGAQTVKKFRSNRRQHAMNSNGTDVHYVAYETEAVTLWVGFGFQWGGGWMIFWFPVDQVDGGDAGADDYAGPS
jgi:hypothetical protein